MPQEYQTTKNNQFLLPDEAYRRTISTIRDYDRRKEQYENLPSDNGAVGFVKASNGSDTTDNTQKMGIIRAEISREIEAVDQAMEIVPETYRSEILRNILFPRTGYNGYAHRNTYHYWKRKFIYMTAENLNLI